MWEGARHRTCTGPTYSGKRSGRPKRGLLSTPRTGKAVSVMALPVADGELAGYVARWDRPGGGKEIRPLVYEDGRWLQKGIPRPRPLYNLQALREHPDAPVLVVEGEKTSDAAGKLFSSYVPTTSMNGANAAHQSDWTPLKGREVIVWPDNDPDGRAICPRGCGPGPHGGRVIGPDRAAA